MNSRRRQTVERGAAEAPLGPLTLAEKLLAAHAGLDVVVPGQIVVARVDVAIAQDGTGPLAIQQIGELGSTSVKAPACVFFIDHAAPAPRSELANAQAGIRAFCATSGATLSDVEMGVCHQRVAESYASPGDLVIGADSHTCTAGALGAFATGMGSTDVAVGMATGLTWLRVPETIRIEARGRLGRGVFAKDLMLAIIGKLGADGATYKALEFGGPGIDVLPMAGRLTLSNMAVEAGAKAGLIASDETTREFLAALGREDAWRPLAPDPGAAYERVEEYDLRAVVPMVARPHTVDNVVPAAEAGGVRVDQVLIGTCTNGRLDDLRAAAGVLRGRRRAPYGPARHWRSTPPAATARPARPPPRSSHPADRHARVPGRRAGRRCRRTVRRVLGRRRGDHQPGLRRLRRHPRRHPRRRRGLREHRQPQLPRADG